MVFEHGEFLKSAEFARQALRESTAIRDHHLKDLSVELIRMTESILNANSKFLAKEHIKIPDKVESLLEEGASLMQSNEVLQALEKYNEAIRLDPTFEKAWFNKGNGYAKLFKPKDAIFCYKRVLELNDRHLNAWLNMGNCLINLGDIGGAIECYDKVLDIDPNNINGIFNKGNLLLASNSLEKARACFKKASELGDTKSIMILKQLN